MRSGLFVTWPVLVGAVWSSLAAAAVCAQDASELIEAGRFEEAVASLMDADSAVAETAARSILVRAREIGLEDGDLEGFVRGMAAVEGLPRLSRRTRAELRFWRGYGLYLVAAEDQKPRTADAARVALPKFREALDLLQSGVPPPSGSLPPGMSAEILITNTWTFIEIQEAIIRRGRS